jgi:hypothetical protein
MEALQYPHKVVLLSTRFRFSDRRLFFTRSRLFFDRIELGGWLPGEHFSRLIPLDAVCRVEWEAGASETTAVFHLEDGEALRLLFDKWHLGKSALELRLSWSAVQFGRFGFGRPAASLKDLAAYSSSIS